MRICIKNANLVAMDLSKAQIEYGADILIDENKIVKIGKKLNINDVDKVIDATDKVVLPGLINTHAHVPMSIFRETLDGYNLQDWLVKKIWPMEDKLTEEDIHFASRLTFIEMIKTGTTTINDMYFMTEEIIKAMLDAKIRLQTTRTIVGHGEPVERLKQLNDMLLKYKDCDSKLTFNIGIHGLYTADEKCLDACLLEAHKKGLGVHMHFCENLTETKDIEKLYNKKPIDILKEKFQNTKVLLAHCVHLTKQDIDKIKDMNISVAHCPVSNLKLGCGIADVAYMLHQGINVALGTDGQGSGSNLDLFETMKFTALLQKGVMQNPEIMPAYEVLKMATINGAKALGLDANIGSIEEGKCADIIIIDMEDAKLKPANDIIAQLVYNVKSNNVITTIIDGNILMEDRKLIGIDENIIYANCEKIIQRISK